jgi:hypothetical protein
MRFSDSVAEMNVDSDAIVLGANKKMAMAMLLGSAAGFAGGITMISQGEHVAGWGVVLFCGWCVTASAYMLLPGAGELRADRSGIQVSALFRRQKLAWSDVNCFYVSRVKTRLSSIKVIGIEYSSAYQKLRIKGQVPNTVNVMQGSIPNNFNRSTEEVCELLNRAKREWG